MKKSVRRFFSKVFMFCGCVCIGTSFVGYANLYIAEAQIETADMQTEILPILQNSQTPVVEEAEIEESETLSRYVPTLLYVNEEVKEEEEPPPLPKTISIDGLNYIGIIEIPVIDVALPIHENWTEAKLDTAPCVYEGSTLGKNLIVGGHNTKAHFALLHTLDIGSEAILSDADGVLHTYVLKEKTVISEMEVAFLRDIGDFELTLFTCDFDSRKRAVLRWNLV
ncbi:MAG: sortase [Bacillota bacterium]